MCKVDPLITVAHNANGVCFISFTFYKSLHKIQIGKAHCGNYANNYMRVPTLAQNPDTVYILIKSTDDITKLIVIFVRET